MATEKGTATNARAMRQNERANAEETQQADRERGENRKKSGRAAGGRGHTRKLKDLEQENEEGDKEG